MSLNPATIVSKVDNVFANVENFNTSLIASINAVEAIFGPGAASTQLALVVATMTAFNAQLGVTKQLVDTESAAFAGIVSAFSNIIAAFKTLASNVTAAPVKAAS